MIQHAWPEATVGGGFAYFKGENTKWLAGHVGRSELEAGENFTQ